MSKTAVIIFIIGTIGIILFSWWASLKDKRYHGIFRFFSFESIFLLVLLNYSRWFHNPLSLRQIFSWTLLLASLILALLGFYLLYKVGKPEDKVENTTQLITGGLYKYIRHPLYCSLLLGGFGVFLKKPSYIGIILCVINLVAIQLTALTEEKEMVKKFGTDYSDYMAKTKRFIPFIF